MHVCCNTLATSLNFESKHKKLQIKLRQGLRNVAIYYNHQILTSCSACVVYSDCSQIGSDGRIALSPSLFPHIAKDLVERAVTVLCSPAICCCTEKYWKPPEIFTVEPHCSKTRQHVRTQKDRLKLNVNFGDACSTNLRLMFHRCHCCSFHTEHCAAKNGVVVWVKFMVTFCRNTLISHSASYIFLS